jgi:hypothetical protein
MVKNHAYRVAATPAVYTTGVTVQAYQKFQGFRRAALLALVGAITGDVTVEIMEAQDSSGTNAQVLTVANASETFTNGTDENRCGVIEVNDADLSAGFTHLAARITGDGATSFAALWELTDERDVPITNATTDDVAFAVASTD